MTSSNYQVVFTGVLRDGFCRRDSIGRLAQRFGLDFNQIRNLLASVRPVVKRCDRQSEGELLVRAFWQAGWYTELMCDGHLLFDGESGFFPTDGPVVEDVKSQVLYSEDTRCSIAVPLGWQALCDLNNSAVIQSGSLQENQFLVVLSQKIADLPAASHIGAYCGAQLKQCAEKLHSSEILTPATPLEEGVFPAYFGEITAVIDAIPVHYLVVCVECDARIYTLFLWCEARHFRHCRQNFDRIVLSFRAAFARVPAAGGKHLDAPSEAMFMV